MSVLPALFFKRFMLLLAILPLLAACSGSVILDWIVPDDGYILHKDIAYGTDARQKLDIYVPDRLAPAHPVLVFFHGGSWQYGSKDIYRFVGQAFATKGYITVIADYRLYPQVYFP